MASIQPFFSNQFTIKSMDISDTQKCNLFNLESVANYLSAPLSELNSYYFELLEDHQFLDSVNLRISEVKKKHGFSKGIFSMQTVSSIDWFAFERVLIYVLIRYLNQFGFLKQECIIVATAPLHC